MLLSDFSLLSFDCYGTLIDWETGILNALRPLMVRSVGTNIAAEEVLGLFARHESAQEAETPGMVYSRLLARVHDRIAGEWGISAGEAESAAFAASVGRWPAFPDSAGSLQYLKRRYRLAILSNVDRKGFAASNARLGVEFDYIFTAEDIGFYKPDIRNFHHMIERLGADGVSRSNILHVAQSLFHDHGPANRAGLASAWINRRHGRQGAGATPMPAVMPHYDFEFASLAQMVEAHRTEATAREV